MVIPFSFSEVSQLPYDTCGREVLQIGICIPVKLNVEVENGDTSLQIL